mmetsp:Transcript_14913/g.32749  ORF Transcript_14913/g.32749 Transcript_14913/m.32749 type:complete len:265 (-) Transcript_14913:66-860(-)
MEEKEDNEDQGSSVRRRPSRKVTWVDVDGACEELLKYEAYEGIKAPLFSSLRRLSFDSCLSLLGEIVCCGCNDPVETLGTPGNPSVSTNTKRAVFAHGHLWKLNSGVEVLPEHLAVIDNWRRRLFFVRRGKEKHKRHASMTYISEKEGDIALACLFTADSEVEEIGDIHVEPVSDAVRYKVSNSSFLYDVAWQDSSRRAAVRDYQNVVPSQLYAFALKWQDASGADKQLVVATGSAEDRKDWMNAILRIKKQAQKGDAKVLRKR